MLPNTRLLYVDNEEPVRRLFRQSMINDSLLIETASDGREALKKLETFPSDIVITDVMMPDMDGLTLLEKIRRHFPGIFVVVVTSQDFLEDTVKAIKGGAYDCISKPFNFPLIRMLIEKITGHKKLLQADDYIGTEHRKKYRFDNIIAQDPKMFEIFRRISDVAATDATVLITGESGTGKELIAEAIHYKSLRKSGPLIRVNCAAITETLINSELFGHEKGAFTGATAQKKGYFELAEKGTIFLDEIGSIPVPTQISLLRILESRTFQRVGGARTLKADTRVICATNKNLSKMIKEKRFREDLFYRINVVSIHAPPLRERKSDIPLLANHFLKKHCAKTKKDVLRISKAAMEMLIRYDWPGNVRELANIIENAVIFCKGREFVPDDLPQEFKKSSQTKDFTLSLFSRSLPLAEATLIRKVLEETNWNLKQAAKELDIARGTLYSKMEKYGIEKPCSGD